MHKGNFGKYLNYSFTITLTIAMIVFGLMYANAGQTQKPEPTPKTTPEPTPNTQAPEVVPLLNYGGREVSIGKHAPLTIVMYYSLTCPHCHEYQKDELPKIHEEFIKEGKVRFVYRDFPTDSTAIKAAKIAWCHGKKQYLEFAHKLLATQERWVPIDPAKIKEADQALHDIATKELGISEADYQKCLANENIEASILRQSFQAQKVYQIDAAPAFLVNDKHYDGMLTADVIRKMLIDMNIHG